MTLKDYIEKYHGGSQAAMGREWGASRQKINERLASCNWHVVKIEGREALVSFKMFKPQT